MNSLFHYFYFCNKDNQCSFFITFFGNNHQNVRCCFTTPISLFLLEMFSTILTKMSSKLSLFLSRWFFFQSPPNLVFPLTKVNFLPATIVLTALSLLNFFKASASQMSSILFAHGCYVTSMSVGGNRMALDHSFTHSLTHSLTHSILINLFIKTGLNRFSYPSPA